MDVSMKYVNGKIKISYSARLDKLSESDGFIGFPEMINAEYDSSNRCLVFSYEVIENDMVRDDKRHFIVHISIPYQDVGGSEIIVNRIVRETYCGYYDRGEYFYYKH